MDERKRFLDTENAAIQLGVKPPTLRHGLCLKGHYFGIRPVKMPNGRLLWPTDAIERLLRSEPCQMPAAAQ